MPAFYLWSWYHRIRSEEGRGESMCASAHVLRACVRSPENELLPRGACVSLGHKRKWLVTKATPTKTEIQTHTTHTRPFLPWCVAHRSCPPSSFSFICLHHIINLLRLTMILSHSISSPRSGRASVIYFPAFTVGLHRGYTSHGSERGRFGWKMQINLKSICLIAEITSPGHTHTFLGIIRLMNNWHKSLVLHQSHPCVEHISCKIHTH